MKFIYTNDKYEELGVLKIHQLILRLGSMTSHQMIIKCLSQ